MLNASSNSQGLPLVAWWVGGRSPVEAALAILQRAPQQALKLGSCTVYVGRCSRDSKSVGQPRTLQLQNEALTKG